MPAERQPLGVVPFAQQADTHATWELVIYERHNRRTFRLPDKGVVTIGRGGQSEIRLEHNSVSRQHLRLHLPELAVEDLGSRNGTWLVESDNVNIGLVMERGLDDEQRLTPHVRREFSPGAVLKLGEVVAQVQRLAPVAHTMPVGPAEDEDDNPVVADPAMIQLYELVERTAATLLPLLILGETGVGKDVLAAKVHRASPRSSGPFVRVNCGALSESLLESELFGHQRGAFTGASEAKPGLFELGNNGTVFLDEIGELPLRTQVKLLHVLETGEVTRVGGTKAQRIDVRFIAATNRELAKDVQAGTFRKDLYFRINTLCLKINPLRERKADIVPLVRYFLRKTCLTTGSPEPEISPEAEAHLLGYGWPGNVRELKNAVERARLLCGHGPLLPEHFPTERELTNPAPSLNGLWLDNDMPTTVTTRRSLVQGPPSSPVAASDEQAAILEALNTCGGNQTRAAELLGISRRTLVNRLNELNLPRPRKGRP